MVELVSINIDDQDSMKYIIMLLIGNIMVVTKYFTKSRNVTDIGSITISSEDYRNE